MFALAISLPKNVEYKSGISKIKQVITKINSLCFSLIRVLRFIARITNKNKGTKRGQKTTKDALTRYDSTPNYGRKKHTCTQWEGIRTDTDPTRHAWSPPWGLGNDAKEG